MHLQLFAYRDVCLLSHVLPPSVYHKLWTKARLEHSYVSIIRYAQRSRFTMSHTAEGSLEGHLRPGPQLQ